MNKLASVKLDVVKGSLQTLSNQLTFLAEIFDSAADSEKALSESGAVGLSSLLREFSTKNWDVVQLLDEAQAQMTEQDKSKKTRPKYE